MSTSTQSISLENPQDTTPESGARRLICAVLAQAFRDLQSCHSCTREEALEWLHSQEAKRWLELLGYEHPERWIAVGIAKMKKGRNKPGNDHQPQKGQPSGLLPEGVFQFELFQFLPLPEMTSRRPAMGACG